MQPTSTFMRDSTSIHLRHFGAKVDALTAHEVVQEIESLAFTGRVAFLTNHNLHSLYLLQKNEQFAEAYKRADITIVDGFPVLLAAKFASRRAGHKLSKSHRVGSLDWLAAIAPSTPIERIAVVGASPASNAKAVTRLSDQLPRVDIRGWSGARWTNAAADTVVRELGEFRPSLVIVGLGMPLQESFLLSRFAELPPAVYATVGGAIDQLSGEQRPAPRWLGAMGIEWLWRLATQPRRLAGRYLVEPILLAGLLLRRRHAIVRRQN
jgi:N-acetylglucosaminyldiphosphoundecaprenol N-acetyl-beta-D-mannosaminyltransferase